MAWIRVVLRGRERQKPDRENVKHEAPKKFSCEGERVFWLIGGGWGRGIQRSLFQEGASRTCLYGNGPVGRTKLLLAKRIIAGFNLERPQEELTAHQGKGWPVRSRALASRKEGEGGRERGCRCSQLRGRLWEDEDTAIRLLLFSQLPWQVISPKRGRWRRHGRFEEKGGYQGHCCYDRETAIGNTGKCEIKTLRGVCGGLVPI